MIYLDYAATTPMCEEAVTVYGEVARRYFGNASSLHDYGSSASRIVNVAREHIGGYLGVEARGIFFTGSGSEANQLIIRSLAEASSHNGRHILTTAAEHSSVRNTLKLLQRQGFSVSEVPLSPSGRVDLGQLEQHIRTDTILASIHHANSEIGTIQDLKAIGAILQEHNVLFHSDCVQSFGKIPVEVKEAQIDAVSLSAHKIYGPKGVGVAYISPSADWKAVLPGTNQQRGFRAGTVDVPGIASLMAAAKNALEQMKEEYEREKELRAYLVEELQQLPFDISIEGDPVEHLPNILGLRIHGVEGQYVMLECSRHGLAISTGSACSVGTEKAAASMEALGRSEQEAREFVRLSLGKQTTRADIDKSVQILKKVLTDHFNMVKL